MHFLLSFGGFLLVWNSLILLNILDSCGRLQLSEQLVKVCLFEDRKALLPNLGFRDYETAMLGGPQIGHHDIVVW